MHQRKGVKIEKRFNSKFDYYRVNQGCKQYGGKDAQDIQCVGIADQAGMDTHAMEYRNYQQTVHAGIKKKVASVNFRELKLF